MADKKPWEMTEEEIGNILNKTWKYSKDDVPDVSRLVKPLDMEIAQAAQKKLLQEQRKMKAEVAKEIYEFTDDMAGVRNWESMPKTQQKYLRLADSILRLLGVEL